ncbi:aldehyde dehydrogenase (NAD) family protein [Bordetella bronchiseptica MBORD675]|uniref:aldehyde dehydrogenase n=1 Tax=Bordetella bronchiseptica TaxID=518 RepID=UPI00028F5E02|nr:aldehyde dehydrogenase [Bordetella bronchiseptica]KDC15483.1 aldehyde dehydrogenase (NAD) family protein [Bordetella bronchiseptica F-1]KDC25228.1 aldehyde dehydrogenase (NAD) family protein [Bordetella bronchiseptica F2]KDC96049.1 aldehyde dehydrogenase (NAD) family protein [Bordetella bronchiseptica MBORD675]CCN05171.1 putative aldehyde dehydrogenase [Bordetella bronchiseptica Bbr77]
MSTLPPLSHWESLAAGLTLRNQAFIDGRWHDGQAGPLAAINPATGQLLAEVTACSQADIDQAVAAARRAFESGVWSRMPRRERKQCMLRLAALIREHAEELALIETLDMGKPIGDTMAFDIPETAHTYAWYAETIDKQYDEIAPTDADALATITREPLGVVAAVVPWNYPLLMASWKVAPALAAGNSVILKPAEQSSLSALRLAELALEAGIPAGVLNVVPGAGPVAGRALGLHMDVDCLAFTGSTATGKRFMEYSGQSNLKQVWLECGGKSPHIIFDDCPDLDRAALAAAIGIFNNQGEVCIAGSRLYVQASIYDTFVGKVEACARAMQPGNPLDPASPMGAMVDERQMARVLEYVESGRREGARLRMGGERVRADSGGYYIEPTIFECARPDLTIVREEIFGPVLAVTRFDGEDEVVAQANASAYGLGSGLWTADLSRAHRVSRRLRAGLVWVNCYFDGDVTVPFGGVKQSGFGRDKSLHALDKYTSLKTTWIRL